MANEQKSRIKLPPVEQIGIVVEDVERAVQFYSSVFGWGPFQILEYDIKGFIYRGRSVDCRQKVALAQSGPIEIELIQVLEGDTIWTDFLRQKGEGIHHLRFRVDDLDGMLAELAREGIEPVFHKDFTEFGVKFAYLNTDKIGGVVFELIEQKQPGGKS
ncbi:MAG: hypothetical protein FJ012_08480 [Chloroflexi bacterium]|nr:hypothetical protein [Chloroflexota bacterium]